MGLERRIPMKIYKMSDLMKMHPLLAKISSLMENTYQDADGICAELAFCEESEESKEKKRLYAKLDLELEGRLNAMLEMANELKMEFGIGICDPSIGAMNIPCYGNSSKALVYVCFDHTCDTSEDEIVCHETQNGVIIPGLTPWINT